MCLPERRQLVSEEITAVTIRQRFSAEEWKRRVTACRRSGDSVTLWCREHNVNTKTYYRWERKLLRMADQQQNGSRFAEIPLICGTQTPDIGDAAAVLRIGNITCEISEGISTDLLQKLVWVLKDNA